MRFLNKFNSISDAKAGKDIYSPQVTLVRENGERQVMYSKDDFEDHTKLQVYGDVIGELSFIEFVPNNIIKYKGTAKVTPYDTTVFGANYIDAESTFDSETGEGVLVFDGDVTSIGNRGFYQCTSLTSLTIPNSVTSIGDLAFWRCSSLTSVEIPNSVTSIGGGAFYACGGLTSVIVDKKNSVYDSRNNCNAIIETATNTLIAGCQSTIIPNSVTSIGYGAFYYCWSLTSVTIPNSVTNIEERSFYSCSGLTSVEIPNSVTRIGSEAFGDCRVLTSVTIGNSITSIGEEAFEYCRVLTSVTCEAVTPPKLGSSAFDYTNCQIYVPSQSVAAYKTTTNWSTYASRIQPIPTTVE